MKTTIEWLDDDLFTARVTRRYFWSRRIEVTVVREWARACPYLSIHLPRTDVPMSPDIKGCDHGLRTFWV